MKYPEKAILNNNFPNNNNSNSVEAKQSYSETLENTSSNLTNIQNNPIVNTTSALFNNIMNTSRLSNFICENEGDNQVSNPDNKEIQNEEKNNEQNKPQAPKDSANNNENEDNFILLESDEENEEDDNNQEINNKINNGTYANNNSLLNNKRKNPNQVDGISNKINKNDENRVNGSNTNDINNKDKYIDTEVTAPKKVERKLYYIRKISSNRKYKLKGTDKLNIQFFIGNLKPHELLPNFVFASEKYYYVPHKCRQVTQNYKGYIISFPGLKRALYDKIIKKDLVKLCSYYFKKPLRKQRSLDIQVKDEKTLNDGVFLNDGIVNFYLKIIEDEYTCGEGKSNNVLILKSFFYNFISNQQTLDLSNNDFSYPESCSYIKTKINVFDYKTLIIPTCENYHWSLIIVNDIDKMKNIFSEENMKAYHDEENLVGTNLGEKTQGGDYPEIFYLDSFYDISQRRMLIILKYLFYEYQKIYSVDVNMYNYLVKNYYKIECYNPDVPKQNNTYDCGIFLLMYAEIFLYNPMYFLKLISKKYKVNKNNEINHNNIIIPGSQNNINNRINISNQNNNNIIIGNGKEKENIIINNNNIISQNESKKDEKFIETENKENINSINDDNNKADFDIDKIDIQIEDTKTKDNLEQSIEIEQKINDYSQNNTYQNGNNIFNSELNNNNELDPEEKAIRNWFSYDMVNAQRNKIKNLIIELSKIVGIKDENLIRTEQNAIIKKYMEKQKQEFDEYFANNKFDD